MGGVAECYGSGSLETVANTIQWGPVYLLWTFPGLKRKHTCMTSFTYFEKDIWAGKMAQ